MTTPTTDTADTADTADKPDTDHPLAGLHFKTGRRHAQLGTQILDQATGREIALVQANAPLAPLVATLFANAPSLFYGIVRARKHLRELAQREGHVEHPETRALRTLLRELEEGITKLNHR